LLAGLVERGLPQPIDEGSGDARGQENEREAESSAADASSDQERRPPDGSQRARSVTRPATSAPTPPSPSTTPVARNPPRARTASRPA